MSGSQRTKRSPQLTDKKLSTIGSKIHILPTTMWAWKHINSKLNFRWDSSSDWYRGYSLTGLWNSDCNSLMTRGLGPRQSEQSLLEHEFVPLSLIVQSESGCATLQTLFETELKSILCCDLWLDISPHMVCGSSMFPLTHAMLNLVTWYGISYHSKRIYIVRPVPYSSGLSKTPQTDCLRLLRPPHTPHIWWLAPHSCLISKAPHQPWLWSSPIWLNLIEEICISFLYNLAVIYV